MASISAISMLADSIGNDMAYGIKTHLKWLVFHKDSRHAIKKATASISCTVEN